MGGSEVAAELDELAARRSRETAEYESAAAEIAPGVWRAFDRALTETRRTFTPAVSHDDLVPFLDALQDAVRCVVIGLPPQTPFIPTSLSAPQVVECVRRVFVDEVHSERAPDAQQAIHILSALGRVQCLLDVNGMEPMPELLAGRDAAGLLIEIAHDMRSPLAAILFLLDMLRTERSGPINSLQRQQLRLIYGASLGVMQLACDMIDSVRGSSRLVAERPADFSIGETFFSVRDIVQPMAEEKGMNLELVIPDADRRIGRQAVLNRILLNLTTNAIKFTDSSAVTISAVQVTGDAVEFSVQDFGREIPLTVLQQLFRPFRRTEARRARTFSSAGLGLSICHKLILALGSELHVSTSPTKGTRFWFVLNLPIAAA